MFFQPSLLQMKADTAYIERKFSEYNELMFGGQLPPIPIRISRARTFLGQVSYRRKRKFFGGWKYSDFVLKISGSVDFPESELEDTILHEMIHYYILYNQMHDTSAHGDIFRRMMNDINSRYGRHITISHRRTKEDMAADTRVRNHYVCISRFVDSRSGCEKYGITVVASTRIFSLWHAIAAIPSVKECRWYMSFDPFFNRYPRVQNPKIYRMEADEVLPHLADAIPLEYRDGAIRSISRE